MSTYPENEQTRLERVSEGGGILAQVVSYSRLVSDVVFFPLVGTWLPLLALLAVFAGLRPLSVILLFICVIENACVDWQDIRFAWRNITLRRRMKEAGLVVRGQVPKISVLRLGVGGAEYRFALSKSRGLTPAMVEAWKPLLLSILDVEPGAPIEIHNRKNSVVIEVWEHAKW